MCGMKQAIPRGVLRNASRSLLHRTSRSWSEPMLVTCTKCKNHLVVPDDEKEDIEHVTEFFCNIDCYVRWVDTNPEIVSEYLEYSYIVYGREDEFTSDTN